MAATRQETNGGAPPPGDSAKAPEPAQEVTMDVASPAAPAGAGGGEVEEPIVLHVSTLTKSEKDKIKRIVTPRPLRGDLMFPKIFMNFGKPTRARRNFSPCGPKAVG